MNLPDDGESNSLRRHRSQRQSHRAAQPRSQTTGQGAQFESEAVAPRCGSEQSHIVRSARFSEFAQVQGIGRQVVAHDHRRVTPTEIDCISQSTGISQANVRTRKVVRRRVGRAVVDYGYAPTQRESSVRDGSDVWTSTAEERMGWRRHKLYERSRGSAVQVGLQNSRGCAR
jgi:hypothetical protein